MTLLEHALGWRCGLVTSADQVPLGPADARIDQASAAGSPVPTGSVSGGAARTPEEARAAAIAEQLERTAAARHPQPGRARAAIPAVERVLDWPEWSVTTPTQPRDEWTRYFATADGRPVWLPREIVAGSRTGGHGLATSSGVAAGRSVRWALLRAIQELLERDAFVAGWLSEVVPRELRLVVEPSAPFDTHTPHGSGLGLVDLTQAWNPHPVLAAVGSSRIDGLLRHAVGIACRSDAGAAAEKATLEWAQSLTFTGLLGADPGPAVPTTFDEHATHWTRHPTDWAELAWWRAPVTRGDRLPIEPEGAVDEQLQTVVDACARAGIDLLHREITTPDVAACGVRVVRVVSPQLTPIHADHRHPHLSGRTGDIDWRWPGSDRGRFPSPHPHPLG